jgi:hypothetical protein
MFLGRAASQLAEKIGVVFDFEWAVHRCDNRIILSKALAAEGHFSLQKRLFPHPDKPLCDDALWTRLRTLRLPWAVVPSRYGR